ncbi:uncharacterized protein Pyn_04050 [Prunus yedoensis var. nudiflora]|uniref:HMA domain-containing protein n=1 Tax=Prunus yedoensis var. nudiflora TaxID=2094558 RepID=A0A314UGJ4_PRUYE|nr:uncharacterized protein Pyn_04050 [Prunus yedoensis var. nudiflora]
MHDLQQKITIEAQIRCDKCRSQAMKIAVAEDGVISVAFQGPNRDKMVITGDGVDAADMAKSLRKKLGYADLVSVEEITEKKAENKVEPTQEKKAENAPARPNLVLTILIWNSTSMTLTHHQGVCAPFCDMYDGQINVLL